MGGEVIIVHEYMGVIDWEMLLSWAPQTVILRAGYGNGCIDLQFRRNALECKKRKISCGAYWHSFAYTEEQAREEAKFCIETLEGFFFDYPICYVIETDTMQYAKSKGIRITKDLAEKMSDLFQEELVKKGYQTNAYINLNL